MRAMMPLPPALLLATLLGCSSASNNEGTRAMSEAAAPAEPKPAPPKKKDDTPKVDPAPNRDAEFPEKITVRVWNAQEKWFFDPRTVRARRQTVGEQVAFVIHPEDAGSNTTPEKGTEITDASGQTWVVTRVFVRTAYVEKKK